MRRRSAEPFVTCRLKVDLDGPTKNVKEAV